MGLWYYRVIRASFVLSPGLPPRVEHLFAEAPHVPIGLRPGNRKPVRAPGHRR
jgi:hypothetical protein